MSWFPAEFHQRGLIGVRSGIFPRTGGQPFPPTNQPYKKWRKWNRIYTLCAIILDGNSLEAAAWLSWGQAVSFRKFHTNFERFHLQEFSGYRRRISNPTTSLHQTLRAHWNRPRLSNSGLEKLQKPPMPLPRSVVIYQKPSKSLAVRFAAFRLFFP